MFLRTIGPMMDDDDPWANIDDDQPTRHLRTGPAASPTPSREPAGSSNTTRLLVALGIAVVVALLVAAALASSRSGWKDRAETAEAKLGRVQAEVAATGAPPERVPAGGVVTPGGDGEEAPDMTEPTSPDEPLTGEVTTCDDFGLDGDANTDGGSYAGVSARGISCDAAKALIVGRGAEGDGRAEAEGFECTQLSTTNERTEWRCQSADAAFRYSFGL